MIDASTLATIVALVVACFALLVALAQVTQQYIGTGQLLRICDNTVFAGAPGAGRRVWIGRQFRFRVLYTLPCIALPHTLWPSGGMHTPASRRELRAFPDVVYRWKKPLLSPKAWFLTRIKRREEYSLFQTVVSSTGEASWISFVRNVQLSHSSELLYFVTEGDADRCPSDLPVVPMPVSLRDVVVLGLRAGLLVTEASFKDQHISMQGLAGALTSTIHPILGSLIHFTPTHQPSGLGSCPTEISEAWMSRLWGNVDIAGKCYTEQERSLTEKMEGLHQHNTYRMDHLKVVFVESQKRSARGDRGSKAADLDPSTSSAPREPNEDEHDDGKGIVAPIRKGANDGLWLLGFHESSERDPDSPAIHLLGQSRRRQSGSSEEIYHLNVPNRKRNRFWVKRVWEIFSRHFVAERRYKSRRTTSTDSDIEVGEPETPLPSPPRSRSRSRTGRREGTGSLSNARCDLEAQPVQENTGPTIDLNPEINPLEAISGGEEDATVEKRSSPREDTRALATETQQDHHTSTDAVDRSDLEQEANELCHSHDENEVPQSGADQLNIDSTSSGQQPRKEMLLLTWKPINQPYVASEDGEDGQRDNDRQSRRHRSSSSSSSEIRSRRRRRRYRQASKESRDGDKESSKNRQNSSERRRDRKARNEAMRERRDKFKITEKAPGPQFGWFWASQADVIPGYWASPFVDDRWYKRECIGAVAVIIEALAKFTEKDLNFRYRELDIFSKYDDPCYKWLRAGRSTYPGYAIDARSGVVVGGIHDYMVYQAVRHEAFVNPLPSIELMEGYAWQTNFYPTYSAHEVDKRTVELLRLDSWLSLVARTNEILQGRVDLVHSTPSIVHHTMIEFGEDFENVDRNAEKGGLQVIQEIAGNLLDFFSDRGLSPAEQTFMLVALLRTVKYMLCLIEGPKTHLIEDILLKDMHVHFV